MTRWIGLSALLLLPVLTFGQYSEEWQVQQGYTEKGILYFDFNQDGYEELTKLWGNTVTVYNGADGYSVFWSLADADHDELLLWDLYRISGSGARTALCIADNTIDTVTTRLSQYAILGSEPLWSSPEVPGYYSFVDTSDTDNDGVTEIIWGVNIYSSDSGDYTSRFYVTNGLSGATEYTSDLMTGYLVGPYAGDIDGDGVVEILLNLYDLTAQTSTLHAFSSGDAGVTPSDQLLPSDIRIGPNYPNPFNPATTIPITLRVRTVVTVNVVDIQGRLVTTLLKGELGAGTHELHWDGRGATGRPVASGMYFAEIDLGKHRIRRPMVLVK